MQSAPAGGGLKFPMACLDSTKSWKVTGPWQHKARALHEDRDSSRMAPGIETGLKQIGSQAAQLRCGSMEFNRQALLSGQKVGELGCAEQFIQRSWLVPHVGCVGKNQLPVLCSQILKNLYHQLIVCQGLVDFFPNLIELPLQVAILLCRSSNLDKFLIFAHAKHGTPTLPAHDSGRGDPS